MKIKIQLFTLFTVLLLSLGSTSNVPETHIITLNVATGAITSSNVDEVSDFGQQSDISNTNFTTHVKIGDIVIWRGISSSAPDTDEVLINSINHEGGARVFSRNTLNDTRQSPGIVVGTVSEGREGDEEKYKISFKVLNNGEQRNGTFHIDPKLQIKN